MTIALVFVLRGKSFRVRAVSAEPGTTKPQAPNLGLNAKLSLLKALLLSHRGLGSASAAYACLDGHSLERKRIEYKQGSGLCKS